MKELDELTMGVIAAVIILALFAIWELFTGWLHEARDMGIVDFCLVICAVGLSALSNWLHRRGSN